MATKKEGIKKEKLVKAIEIAKGYQKAYRELGTNGSLSLALAIDPALKKAQEILKTFNERSPAEIKKIIKELETIE